MTNPDFTDLRELALALEGQPAFDTLRQTIESTWRAQSCVADIRQAKDACDVLSLLRKSPRQRNSLERATTENALLVTALMLYARATSTSGQKEERGSIQIDPKHLTAAELHDHELLIEIRNRALAHVYRDTPIDQNLWHEDAVFAVDLGGQGWKPAVGSSRISFHTPTFNRLLRMIPVIDRVLVGKFHKRMNAVTELINGGGAPIALFQQFRFDPVQRFGGVQAVKTILNGISIGHATVMSNKQAPEF